METGTKQQAETKTCQHCGHTWEPRVDDPRCCPYCKRYDWEKK
jgi:predicted Zn-ribbon and HTH transcriptional regulator